MTSNAIWPYKCSWHLSKFVNDTLQEYLNICYVCYLDDLLIYLDNLKDYRRQVRNVFRKLQKTRLFVKPERFELKTTKTIFLEFVITPDNLSMDPEKVSAFKD